jgi:hypothetical protein
VTFPLAGSALADVDAAASRVGEARLPVSISVVGYGTALLPVRVSVVTPAIAGGGDTVADASTLAAVWGPVVRIDGADVTASVIGEIVVEAEEGSARIADLTLHVAPGTAVAVTSWTGRAVSIMIADMSSGVPLNALPLFNGLVDLPTIVPRSGKLALRCTDNRQAIISGLTREEIDALIPEGRYSAAVFDPGVASLMYANDRLSTVPAALDLSPTGALRLTEWAAKSVADLSFDDDQVLDESMAVDIAERSQIINRVDLTFSYRFPRVKAEGYEVNYNFLELNHTSFGYWVKDGNSFIQRAAIVAALESSGGSVVSIAYIPLPTTAKSIPGTDGFWLPSPATDGQFCLGFSAVVSFDYAQTIEETHQITVYNAASVAALGTLATTMSGALEGVYDDTVAVEQSILLYRQQVTHIPPKNLAPVVVGFTNSSNATLTTDSDRTAANAAMETLIAVAAVKIAEAHRQHRVSFDLPCTPVLDVDKTLAVVAGGVTAKGKVRRVTHRLNTDAGLATSSVELAICSLTGTGLLHDGDAVAAPAGTEDGPTNTLEAPVVTWNGLYLEDNVLTVSFPGVEEAERAKAQTTIETLHAAPLVEDVLEIET